MISSIFSKFRPDRGDQPSPTSRLPVSDTSADYELGRRLEWRRHPDETGRFLNVFIEQNNTCNLRCLMCGFSDDRASDVPRYHMPTPLFETIAREVFPLTTYLHISLMTEPFMTPNFPERLQLVRKYGVPYCRVVTNGTLLTDRVIERVIDSQITTLTISVDGGTREVYEDIRRGSNFDKVLTNIERFKELRARRGVSLPRLQINHVLMQRNVDHVDDFLRVLDRLRPEQVDVRTVEKWSFDYADEARQESFYAKVREVRGRFTDYFARNGIEDCGFIRDREGAIELPAATGGRMPCRRPWDTLAIHANGDVQPCMSWTRPPFGNLARQSFEEIWAGDEIESLRDEFTRVQPGVDCQHCTIKKSEPHGVYDDFFYRLISKPPEALRRS